MSTSITTGEKLVKCTIEGCDMAFHQECIEKMKSEEEIPLDNSNPVFICPAHYCVTCKHLFKEEDQVASCVRSYRSCHALQNGRQEDQCFNLNKFIPINATKFVCKEYINEEIEALNKTNSLLSTHQIISLTN